MKRIPMPPATAVDCLQVADQLYIDFHEPGIFWAAPSGVFTANPPLGLYSAGTTLPPMGNGYTAASPDHVTLYFFEPKKLWVSTLNLTIQAAPCTPHPLEHHKRKKRKARKS